MNVREAFLFGIGGKRNLTQPRLTQGGGVSE